MKLQGRYAPKFIKQVHHRQDCEQAVSCTHHGFNVVIIAFKETHDQVHHFVYTLQINILNPAPHTSILLLHYVISHSIQDNLQQHQEL